MTLSMMTLSVMTQHNDTQHNDIQHSDKNMTLIIMALDTTKLCVILS